MNAATEARISELDRTVDALKPTLSLAEELFGIADVLHEQATLRNALADSTTADDSRRAMAAALFGGKLSETATSIIGEAAGLRWGIGSRLTDAINRQGLRVLFGTAQAAQALDQVESELFHLNRAVAADTELRQALDNRNAPLAARLTLLSDLLSTKADPVTLALAQRAVAASQRSFEATTEEYLRLAAAIRERAIATVTVAQPLTAAQTKKLREILVRKLDREVNLQIVIDPSVLGGARVKVGDEVIEGTVAARLAAAQQQLTQ
ncbi:MAG TPA: F0F1 ATP synthase subunit delta [Propionicimonas sp.]|nr:F0F1 ATP synthase subunit delta [Propionicimonas sp.]